MDEGAGFGSWASSLRQMLEEEGENIGIAGIAYVRNESETERRI